ncbi:Gluconate transport-inducing protein [Brettanomyces nanus]|uniref:peptidyl-tRNA hydrolase n=1 Tax=Eeniella nana TaxID=13502 RepID=A0A875S295_EENNA|nr:Gluconate transport-inducing protein [Brettanomyces nanus]QPG74212.1 Gluconate transport-inducing protein [Brettanomyces nanus]
MSTSQLVTIATVSLFTGCCLGAFLALPVHSGGLQTPTLFGLHLPSNGNSSTPSSTDYLSDEELSEETKLKDGKSQEEEGNDDESLVEINSSSLNQVGGEVRMALVVRTDLDMTNGKVAAQCAHAAVTCYKMMSDSGSEARNLPMLKRWYGGGQAKITLKCQNKDLMDLLFAKALSLNVNAYVVHDAGRTQVVSGSATVLGLGPAPKAVLDQITGKLRLL